MKNKYSFLIFGLSAWILFSCNEVSKTSDSQLLSESQSDWVTHSGLSKEAYHDKVLGFLVGSAIGDAMGAPTEMWSREDIREKYGFVEGLDDMIREKSPEGIWIDDLPAGGTTDDTRWKVLTMDYLAQEGYAHHPKKFSAYIRQQYKEFLDIFMVREEQDSILKENSLMKSQWLLEWDKVSEAYLEEDLDQYIVSLGRFYGGEMVCAGLLYAPAFGLLYPKQPEKAYDAAYNHSIFDLGYAKDLSAISAAMVAMAMDSDLPPDSLMTTMEIDPRGYFESRLVGRTAYTIWLKAKEISEQARSLDTLTQGNSFYPPSLQRAYELLDQHLQDMPFHAGEISLQVYTAMVFSDFDFMKTLAFLTNYGRDNDTTAALAGAILGTYYGLAQLPERESQQVFQVSKEWLDMDLELVARNFTSRIYPE
jgi:hypothetical protein